MKGFLPQKAYLVCMVIMSVFVSILSGCGGGGGGHWNEPVTPSSVTVTATVPVDGATLVSTNTNLTATFTGPMDPATLISPATSFTLNEFLSGTPVAGVVTYLGNTATFNPNSDLLTNTKYSATITTAAKDPAGKPLAKNFTWTFTTGLTADATAPTLVTTGAADGDIGLPINRNSTATFSEPMDPATLISPATSFTLQESVSGTPVTGVVTYIGNTATFNPNSDLKPNTRYTSTITTGARDLAGNALVSGPRVNPWSWTTGAAADLTAPTVTITSPLNLATNVPVNQTTSATFSEEMRQTTIVTANFKVRETLSGLDVPGTVAYVVLSNIATFSPLANLKPDTDYTVTVTNGSVDLAGNALVVPAVSGLPTPNPWTFRTAASGAGAHLGPAPVNLGSAGTFRVLAGSALTNTDIVSNRTSVNGDAGVSPGSTVNGFTELVNIVPPFKLFAGVPIAADAKVALTAAYLDAQSRSTNAISLPGQLGGLTFAPGLYVNSTTSGISGTGPNAILTLDGQGDPTAVWIFKMGSTLITDPGTSIVCTNGCKAENIFWQVGSSATLGTNSIFYGTIMGGISITMNTNAVLHGRALTQTGAVSLDTNQLVP